MDGPDVALADVIPSHEHISALTGMGIQNVGQLATKAVEAQRYIDSTGRVPGENATPEEIRAFRVKMGAAETADGYAIPETKDSNMSSIFSEMRTIAHEEGVRKAPFERMVKRAEEMRAARDQEFRQAFEAECRDMTREIKDRLGPKAEEHLAMGKRVADKLLDSLPEGSKVREIMVQTGLGEMPALLEFLAHAGQLTQGDSSPAAQDGIAPMETSEEALREMAMEIRAMSKEPAFRDRRDPGYEALVHKYQTKLREFYDKSGGKSIHDAQFQAGHGAF